MKLALLDDYHRVATRMADWGRLAGRIDVTSFDTQIPDADELVRRLAPFDAILAMRERTAFPRSVLERLPNLRLLITTGMWNASIDVDAATELGIQVCGTRDVGHLTAELTLGLARQISHEERAIREGRWHVRLGHSVRGRTLGILGLGNLGRQVAAFGHMLGMETIAWSQNLTAAAAAVAGCKFVERAELFSASDYLTIHTRLSDRTRGLVGAAELALMKPTAYLINTSRDPIVDEAALFQALSERRIAGRRSMSIRKSHCPWTIPSEHSTTSFCRLTWALYRKKTIGLCIDSLEAVEGFLAGRPLRALNALPGRSQ